MSGRDLRLSLGVVLVFVNVGLLVLDAVGREPVTTQDVTLHIALLVGALFLIDPGRLVELVRAAAGGLVAKWPWRR